MITHSGVTSSMAHNYYREDDYYKEEGFMPARNFGQLLAEERGEGFSVARFHEMIRGELVTKDGVILEFAHKAHVMHDKNGKEKEPEMCMDMHFAPSKSYSLATLLPGDGPANAELRRRLMENFVKANDGILKKLESNAQVRTTSGKKTVRESVGQIAGTSFLHDSSRRGDFQLHMHNVMSKYTVGQDGKLRAIDTRELFGPNGINLKLMDADAKVELRRGMDELGIATRTTKDGFEIAAYSQETLDRFSKGREQIIKELKRLGHDIDTADAGARDMANKNTRTAKTDIDRQAMIDQHLTELKTLENEARQQAVNLVQGDPIKADLVDSSEAVSRALEHLTTNSSTILSREVLALEAVRFADYRVESDVLLAEIDHQIAQGLILTNDEGRLTTKSLLDMEQGVLDTYQTGLDRHAPISTLESAMLTTARFEAEKGFTLTRGQRDMINNLVTRGDTVQVVEGDAGTGKSTAMEVFKRLCNEQGIEVRGLTPTTKAREALNETTIQTDTIQKAMMSEKYWNDINDKTVLVMDESGLVDIRQMDFIAQKVKEKGARLVTVGDTKQFGSVGAGAISRQLHDAAIKDGRVNRLNEMNRGKGEVKDLHFAARDNPAEAIDMMIKQNRVTVAKNEKQKLAAIADLYAQVPADQRHETVVTTGKNTDRIAINAAVRKKIGIADEVKVTTFESSNLSQQERRSIMAYKPGSAVQFPLESKDLGISKGEVFSVQGIKDDRYAILKGQDGRIVEFDPNKQTGRGRAGDKASVGHTEEIAIGRGERIRMMAGDKDKGIISGTSSTVTDVKGNEIHAISDLGHKFTIDASKPQNLRHGYCQTGHSLQGDGRLNVISNLSKDDPTVDRKSFYTNATRSKTNYQAVVDQKTMDDLEALKKAVSREKATETSLDIANNTRADSPPAPTPISREQDVQQRQDESRSPATGEQQPAQEVKQNQERAPEPAREEVPQPAPISRDEEEEERRRQQQMYR